MLIKILGWLAGARNGEILELGIKSGINKNPGLNLVSLVHIIPDFV